MLGDGACALYRGSDKLTEIELPDDSFIDLLVGEGRFYLLSPTTVYRLDDHQWNPVHRGEGITAMAVAGERIIVGTTDGFYEIDDKGMVVLQRNNRLPVPEINKVISDSGRHWFSTHGGAYYKEGRRSVTFLPSAGSIRTV